MTRHQLHSDSGRVSRRGDVVCETIVVTWRVDADALAQAVRGGVRLRGAGAGTGGTMRLLDDPPRDAPAQDAELRLTVRRQAQGDDAVRLTAEVTAHFPGRPRVVQVASAEGEAICWQGESVGGAADGAAGASDAAVVAGGWLHIDVAADDWSCALSLRPGREPCLAYARTDLFQHLRIPGGRYEPLRGECARRTPRAARPDHLEASA